MPRRSVRKELRYGYLSGFADGSRVLGLKFCLRDDQGLHSEEDVFTGKSRRKFRILVKSEQTDSIVMRPILMRRARTRVTEFAEAVDALPDAVRKRLLGGDSRRKMPNLSRNSIDQPMSVNAAAVIEIFH